MRRTAPALVAFLVLFGPRPAVAQCPDGSMPRPDGSCDSARQAAPAIATPIPSPLERGRRFLILPFRNLTRSPDHEWLIQGSPVLLSDALRPWEEVRVVPDERLYPALERQGLMAGTALDHDRVLRVAAETGAWTAVLGDIVALRGRLEIRVRALDRASGRELYFRTDTVGSSEDPRDAYSRIGTSLLRLAGLDSVTVDLAAVTTRSVDAYRAYARGLAQLSRGEARRARSSLQEAVRRDPDFAQAYARLAVAAAWEDPSALADAGSPVFGWIQRAAALSSRLPPRDRQLVGAAHAAAEGRLDEARRLLDGMIARDSTDLEAMRFLADLELYDPILVPVPGGERPRGSSNRSATLAKRLLELEPTQHHAYRLLVDIYGVAGGAGRGMIVGLRGERGSLAELLRARWDRVYVAVLGDTIAVVPVESLGVIPRETLALRRREALTVARGWADRWIAAAPAESEAYLMLSYLHEAAGYPDSALLALERADRLGIETGMEHVPLRRLALLVEAGRHRAALRHADVLIETLTPRDLETPTVERAATLVRALGSLFCLYAASGRAADAGRLVDLVARRSGGQDSALREVLLDPTPFGNPAWALPSAMRVAAAESLLARAQRSPLPRGMDRFLPVIVELVMADAVPPDQARLAGRASDVAFTMADRGAPETANALARVVDEEPQRRARFAAAPWYRP